LSSTPCTRYKEEEKSRKDLASNEKRPKSGKRKREEIWRDFFFRRVLVDLRGGAETSSLPTRALFVVRALLEGGAGQQRRETAQAGAQPDRGQATGARPPPGDPRAAEPRRGGGGRGRGGAAAHSVEDTHRELAAALRRAPTERVKDLKTVRVTFQVLPCFFFDLLVVWWRRHSIFFEGCERQDVILLSVCVAKYLISFLSSSSISPPCGSVALLRSLQKALETGDVSKS
jgi:hypothetical protein